MLDTQELLTAIWDGGSWLIPAILIITGLQLAVLPRLKGAVGEMGLRWSMKGIADDEMHDVVIPDGRGGLTQIDHLFLAGNGIHVVETKNYRGRIFGGARQKTWTQKIGRKSIRINNPLRQNWGHIKAVEALVGADIPVHGVVIFGQQAKFPKGMPEGVTRPRELANLLKQGGASGEPREEWLAAWQRLKTSAKTDTTTRRMHREALTAKHGRDYAMPAGVVIPARQNPTHIQDAGRCRLHEARYCLCQRCPAVMRVDHLRH